MSDIFNPSPLTVDNNGAVVGARQALNLIPGANIGITASDNSALQRIDVTISAGGGGGGGGGVAISAGTNSTSTGTVIFSNSNGVSFGMDTNAVVTGSVAAQTNQTIGIYATGNTGGQSSSSTIDARSLSVSAVGIVTAGLSGGMLLLSATSAAQTNQSVGLYAVGNTTQNSSTTLDARTLSFDGLGGVTVGFSNGSVQISGPQTAAQTNQTVGLYAVGNTTQNSSTTLDARTLSFDGLGAATVGFSNGSIQISAPVQTNQTAGFYAVGNTTQNSSTTLDARTLSFDGLGGVSVGYSNGSIQISGPQTAAQTNQNNSLFALGNTTQNSSTVLNASALSLNGLGIVTVGYSNGSIQLSATQSNQNVTAANGGFAFQTLSFSNVNGVSFGTSAGSAITASVAAQTNQSIGYYAVGNTTQSSSTTLDARTVSFNFLGAATGGFSNGSIDVSVPVQTNQTVGLYAIGNTTQNSSTTLDARTLSFNGLGAVTVGYSNGSIQISGATAAPSPVNFSAGAASANLGSVVFSNSNGVSFGLNGSTITGSVAAQTNQTIGLYGVGNTTQNSSTTLDARTLSFDGLGAQTVGFSNGSIQLSVPATSSLVGVNNITVSTAGSTISVSGPNAMSVYRNLTQLTTVGSGISNSFWSIQPFYLQAPLNASYILLGGYATVNTAANTSSAYLDVSISGVFYTQNASTLSSVFSFSNSLTQIWRSNSTSSVNGALGLSATFPATTLQPGEYWLAVNMSTNSTATGGANTTGLGNTFSVLLANTFNTLVNELQPWGAGSNNSNAFYPAGVISTGATLASIPFSSITMSGLRAAIAPVYFELRNNTYQ